MPLLHSSLISRSFVGAMMSLCGIAGSVPANADGMPVRVRAGAVDMRVENGVRVWRPRPQHVRARPAAAVTQDGLAAHMLAGHMLYSGRKVGVIVPVEVPVYVGGSGGSRFFAPAPGKVAQAPRTAPLLGGSGRASQYAPAGAMRASRGLLGR